MTTPLQAEALALPPGWKRGTTFPSEEHPPGWIAEAIRMAGGFPAEFLYGYGDTAEQADADLAQQLTNWAPAADTVRMDIDTPRADHNTYSADQLAEWLLVNADAMGAPEVAALTLLIQHRVWLLRPDFRRVAVILDDDDPALTTWARIDFRRALQAVEAWRTHEEAGGPVEEICLDQSIGNAAIEVLKFAALLRSGQVTFARLDVDNIRLAVEATARAGRRELLGGELVPLVI